MSDDFTQAEFDILVEQLTDHRRVSFEMLCRITERFLRPTVRYWCFADSALKSEYEEDIMQEIHLRFIMTCKVSFLLRNGPAGPVNRDADGFRRWMYTVARNVKRDYAARLRRLNGTTRGFEEGEEEQIPALAVTAVEDTVTDDLSRSFSIVIGSGYKIYKILSWMAQALIMLELDSSRTQATAVMLERFEKKTLGEMYTQIVRGMQTVPWLSVSAVQRNQLQIQLNESRDNRRYAEIRYGECFMKKGGKYSVSDWTNRMNTLIKQVMNHGTSDRS